MSSPTRFPYGLTTTTKASNLGQFILPDVTKAHPYFNDFDVYAAGDWTITQTSTSAAALANIDGGALTISNGTADDSISVYQLANESFKFQAGKKLWFKARFQVSDATDSDVLIGLAITDTTPLDATDGVFFLKSDNSAVCSLKVVKNSTATTTTAATLVSATMVTLGYYYNGVDEIQIFVNDVQVGTSAVTNLPDDEELAVIFAVQNGAAASKTMTVDYILAAKER
jgi:hypothetical protein